MSSPKPKPGWYPDPEDKERLRWWDGDGWSNKTGHGEKTETKAKEKPARPAISFKKPESIKDARLVLAGLIGVLLLALGIGFLGSEKQDSQFLPESSQKEIVAQERKEAKLKNNRKKKALLRKKSSLSKNTTPKATPTKVKAGTKKKVPLIKKARPKRIAPISPAPTSLGQSLAE